MKTRTGGFSIGFRQGWSDWQKKLSNVVDFAKKSGFEAVDVGGQFTQEAYATVTGAGLKVGSVDLLDFGRLTQPDAGARKELIAKNVDYIRATAAMGAKIFFTVIPGESNRSRKENYTLAVEAFEPLAHAADLAGAKIVIEGYPGGPPHYSLLCCTPETYRSFIKDVGGKGVGVNYDPSHLIRLGVDPIRFLREFAPHVYHVHGKDTELMPDAVYEFGLYQPSVFSKEHGFGQNVWRYTIPGQGQMRWTTGLQILADTGFKGVVSVELEDEFFNGTEAGEKAGLVHSLNFLASA